MLEKYIKIPKKLKKNQIDNFFKKKFGNSFIELSKIEDVTETNPNKLKQKEIYRPNLEDLYRLFSFISLNKRTTVLEFGTGWSTLVMALALKENKKKYLHNIKGLRRKNPFEIHVVDCNKHFKSISQKRIINFFKDPSFVKFTHSKCNIAKFNNQICNEYSKIPLVNPDFIYLDGPDQKDIQGSLNGINLRHNDFMPMNSDLLKIEPFLIPGTIIITDGRGANAQFLKNNFIRKWEYFFDQKFDQHIFYLNEKTLGKINSNLLKFYLK